MIGQLILTSDWSRASSAATGLARAGWAGCLTGSSPSALTGASRPAPALMALRLPGDGPFNATSELLHDDDNLV